MSKAQLPEGHVWLEVMSGVEGPSLYVGDDGSGHRLAGPKPWGGGSVQHRFAVNIEELERELTGLKEATNGHE